MNLSKNDKKFTAVMVLVILLLGTALFLNYKIRLDRSAFHEPVGVVTYKNHIVERRYGDRFVWEEISRRADVFLYDSVLTKAQSDANITLNNGLSFDIAANTMIEIDEQGIVLQGGSLRAKNTEGEKALIRTKDGTVIDLRNGGVKIEQTKNGLNVTVTQGQLKIKKGDKEQTIEKGDNLQIDTKGSINKRKISITSMQPADGQVLLTETGTTTARLAWQADFNNYTVELSSSNDFSQNRRVYRTTKNSMQASLPVGTWYWRVNSGKNISAIQILKVRQEKKILVYTPSNNTTITSKAEKKNHRVLFKWKKEGPDAVRLVLSKNKDLQNPIVDKVIHDNKTEVNDLEEDRYYWQIKNEHKDNENKVYSFRIEKGDERKIVEGELQKQKQQVEEKKKEQEQLRLRLTAAPRLLSPLGNSTFKAGKPFTANFRFSATTNANRYLVQVYQMRGRARQILVTRTTPATNLALPINPRKDAAKVYWRVRAQRIEGGRVVSETPFRTGSFTLKVSLRPPTVTKVIVKQE